MKDRKTELLVMLQEESAEVVQAASKYLRFGADSSWKGSPTNAITLETEIGDFLAVLKLLIEEGHVDGINIQLQAETKATKLENFMSNKSEV
jgi:NTP pyrophosphatase (non-canonical NTP hydrolase)